MKKRSLRIIDVLMAVAVCGLALWLFCFSGIIFASARKNTPNREALVEVYQETNPGDAEAEVRSAFQKLATKELRLLDNHSDEWVVRMPLEFGASDWKLLIKFQNGKVTSVRIRTSDGPPPAEAPPDKDS